MAKKRRAVNAGYVYGNTARKLDVVREIEREPRKRLSRQTAKNREKAYRMNFGYVVFLAVALGFCGFVLVGYVKLQSELTAKTRHVAALESQLNALKIENDEEFNRINASVDLEHIKQIAINELGMTYAREGQIITYSSTGNDYMRKVADYK